MRTIEIVNLVCAILWALCIIGVSWCWYKANKTRTEMIKLLDEIETKTSSFEYYLSENITVDELLKVLNNETKITTEIGIISNKEYREEYPENLDKIIKKIRIWIDWDNDAPILQLIDNDFVDIG